MKYLHQNSSGAWLFDPYFEYLASIEQKLPAEVYAYASNFAHYSLDDRSSLHDAWLDYLLIREPAEGARKELRAIEIELCFFGPYHDRKQLLYYRNVRAFDLRTPAGFQSPPSDRTGHGDLLVHEFRLEDEKLIAHELLFSRGSVFVIVCEAFSHREELLC